MAKKDLIKRADGSYSPRGLWDNIRANKGSGKEPTKEMLAQEKKIKREMANGGKLSHFYPSNIQAYAEGGPIDDALQKFYRKNPTANIYASPFYTNALVGNFKPGYIAGIETDSGLGRKAPGFYASAYAGQQYNPSIPFNTLLSPEQQAIQNSITQLGMPAALGGAPNGPNIMFGGKVGWQGPVVKGGIGGASVLSKGMPRLEAGLEYAPSTGIGGHLEAGGVFPFGNNYRNGLVKAGKLTGIINPYVAGMTINSTKGAKGGLGVRAEAEYRPRKFGSFPMSFYGKAALTAGFGAESKKASTISNVIEQDPNYNPGQNNNTSVNSIGAGPQDKTLGTMFRPHVSGEVGIRVPLQQIESPNIKMPQINMSPLNSFIAKANGNSGENLQMQGGDPMGDFGARYNASPIEGRWNNEAGDIYINHDNALKGLGSEPIIYDPADPEAVFNNQYSKGGAMNFKSPAAYKAWLAYGHASGEFAKTPGNQAVSIKGQPHKVQHAFGGNMYSMGGRAFAQGGQLTEFTEGGSHEMNPLGGIPQGFAPDGKLNLVEQGETKLNAADYVFSDQIKVSKETASLYDLPRSAVGKTFAEVSKKANRPDSRRENDTIEQVAIQRDLENLMQAQEQQKETEKQEAIAEMQSKYPDLQVVDQAAMQQADAEMQAGMQQPMMDEAAMMQQQQQMAPPAQAPQEIDPAMMAQMQQQGMMRHGGKMYNMGGHMYSAGGGMMALRGIGAGAYGVGEGLLDTLTFGLTDSITDKGYEKLSQMGNLDERQAGRLDATRGFGNTAGAITGAVISGGATTDAAISEGIEGAAQGVAALPSTGEKADKVANAVGQLGSMYGSFAGPSGDVVPQGALKGSKAANALMNAPQNKFITQGMNIANQMFADGGFLNQPTNGMFTNQFALGGAPDEPTAVFNIAGTPVTLTLSEALKNPTILEVFETPEAIMEYFQSLSPEARAASMQTVDVAAAPTAPILTEEELMAQELLGEDIAEDETLRLEGETDAQYESRMKKLKTDLDQKSGLEAIKANPILAGAMALPALYNVGRGLFGKVDQLDAGDYKSRMKISPYEMNIDPQLAETRRAFGTSIQAAKNAAPGGGSYLATLSNLANTRQQAIRDLYAQKENFDKGQKLEADKFNAQVEQGNLERDLAIQQYNAQAKAAKQNMLATGLGQIAQAAEGLSSTDLQEAYLRAISPDFAGNFQYLSIPEQIAAATRKNKGQNS